jgi:hypothetical protein
MKELINLTIINDSDCTLPIPLFQNNVASINATTKYQWDVTTADLSCGFGSIIVNGSVINITYIPTLVGLVDSLNALNYGFFCTEVIGANTYIYTKDNTNTYSLLDLCPTPTTTTTTTTTSSTSTTTTAIPTTTTTTTTTSSTSTTTTAAPLSVRVYATQTVGANGDRFIYSINSSPSTPLTFDNTLTVTSGLCGLLATLSVPIGDYLHIACDDGSGNRYGFTTTTVITAGVPSCPLDLANSCAANIQITVVDTTVTFVTSGADITC